jgi:NADPH:quinone reductase
MLGTGRTTMAILEVAAPTPGDVVLVTAARSTVGKTVLKP